MENTSTSRDPVWDAGSFVGGSVCLDFANTQGGQDKTRDRERLTTYQAAIGWACAASLVTREEGRSLKAAALKAPAQAARSLAQLQRFRECLYRLFFALTIDQKAAPADEDGLRRAVAAAVAIAYLERGADGCRWKIDREAAGLNVLLHRIALGAQQFLLGSELRYLRECDRCSWLFIDRTKNKRRRWCRTETCGNRTRAARHYQLLKASGASKPS